MEDFSEEGVASFLDCVYSGTVVTLSKDVFRDLHKMSHVFQVGWLTTRCVGYFKQLLEEVPKESYEFLLFLFEEAYFVKHNCVKPGNDLHSLVRKAMQKSGRIHFFVGNFLKNLNSRDRKEVGSIIELAEDDSGAFLKSLSDHLKSECNHLETSSNFCFIIESIDLRKCRTSDTPLFEDLFDTMQNAQSISVAGLKWVVSWYRSAFADLKTTQPKSLEPLASYPDKIPNLFRVNMYSFKNLSFEDCFSYLANHPEVCNMLMFVEGLYLWIAKHPDCSVKWDEEWEEKCILVVKRRDWMLPPKECFTFVDMTETAKGFFDGFGNSKRLSDSCTGQGMILTPTNAKVDANFLHGRGLQPSSGLFASLSNKVIFCGCEFDICIIPGSVDTPESFDIKVIPKSGIEGHVNVKAIHFTFVVTSSRGDKDSIQLITQKRPSIFPATGRAHVPAPIQTIYSIFGTAPLHAVVPAPTQTPSTQIRDTFSFLPAPVPAQKCLTFLPASFLGKPIVAKRNEMGREQSLMLRWGLINGAMNGSENVEMRIVYFAHQNIR